MDGGGKLSISVLPTFAMRRLVPCLDGFQQRHRDILIDITINERLVNFWTDAIGTGVRYGLGHWPNTEATLFVYEDVVVFYAPAQLEREPTLSGPADLASIVSGSTAPAPAPGQRSVMLAMNRRRISACHHRSSISSC